MRSGGSWVHHLDFPVLQVALDNVSFLWAFPSQSVMGYLGRLEEFWVSSWRGWCRCQWVGCCCSAACNLSPLSQQALGISQLLFVVITRACSTWCNTQQPGKVPGHFSLPMGHSVLACSHILLF